MDPVQLRQYILAAVGRRLTTARLPWRVEEDRVRCDGPLAVITRPDCDGAPAGAKHVELGVQVTAHDGTESLLWDCAVGLADREDEAIMQAVEVWASRTMPVFWELFAQDGTFAAHYPADDPDGIAGWHVIAGGISGWGVESASTVLQQWVVDNPLLPKLSALTDTFDRPELNGVRIFFGGPPGKDTAEVRVNGISTRSLHASCMRCPGHDCPGMHMCPPTYLRSIGEPEVRAGDAGPTLLITWNPIVASTRSMPRSARHFW